jgi:cytosine/adenosine deaminase-related metal-dependent hydrolase/ubiquinone/menaquinone biosynthesis C-methylase UbiE
MHLRTQSSFSPHLHGVSNAEAFALWSRTYDSEINPLLALEKRFLERLLPPVSGRDVVDIGCGTGRWLQELVKRHPASLVGIDNSPAMLSRAVARCGGLCRLLLGSAPAMPLPNASFDLALASFSVSYLDDLKGFASETARVTRPGARVFVSDVHPQTAAAFQWKRAFHVGQTSVELTANPWKIAQIASCFEECGLQPVAVLEPEFGAAEDVLLDRAGRREVYVETAGRPAIYILEFAKEHSRPTSTTARNIAFAGANVSLGPDEAAVADVRIGEGRIVSIGSCEIAHSEVAPSIDLSGYLLLPGLINAHDHLDFGLFPRLGHGPYSSFVEWANDIHDRDSSLIARFKRVPKDVSLWWGAIRNLLCGVTSVCHHNPLYPAIDRHDFPVRILSRFGWAHSIEMDRDLSSKFDCTPADAPFILHLGEGIGETSAREIYQLDSIHALDERTILVHGLAFGEEEMKLVNRRRAAIVWCPTSNKFLFGRTHTKASVMSAERIVLGSDSPLTASGDLLDEIRFARAETDIDAREVYEQVTTRAARVFRLESGEGTLLPYAVADLIAVSQRGRQSPADILGQLTYKDVELVMLGGRVHLASEEVLSRLPAELASGLCPIQVESTIRWIRAPLQTLFEEAERVLGPDLVLGGRRVRNLGCS